MSFIIPSQNGTQQDLCQDFGNDQKGYSIIATGTAGTADETYIQLWQAKILCACIFMLGLSPA